MQKEGFEAVLAYSARRWSMMAGTESGGNARYYVGFDFPHKEMVEKGRYVPYMKHDSIVFIPREGEPAFVTKTKHEAEKITEQSWMSDVRPIYKRFQQDHGRAFQAFAERTEDLLLDRGLNLKGRIGIGGINTPMEIWMEFNHRFPEASIHNVTGDLHRLRMVKSKNELKLMRAAARINDAALHTMIDVCRPGISEWEVHQAMEATMFRHGADNVWNEPIKL